MSDARQHQIDPGAHPTRPGLANEANYRRVLWIAMVLNLMMFCVEFGASHASGSVSLMADAIDFFGDTVNYAVSLAVLTMAPAVRTKAAMLKAACMLAFGVFVLGRAVWAASHGGTPDAHTMGAVALLALIVNVGVAGMLYSHRNGDANMRSVWLCSRNDALSNAAVMLAAVGVLGTANIWPDLIVAAIMGLLAISSALTVFKSARRERSAG